MTMRRVLAAVLLLFVAPVVCLWLWKPLDDFNGLVYGQHVPEAEEAIALLRWGDRYTLAFRPEEDDDRFLGVSVNELNYLFRRDRFMAGMAVVKGNARAQDLLQAVSARYGEPTSNIEDMQLWYRAPTTILIYFDILGRDRSVFLLGDLRSVLWLMEMSRLTPRRK